MERTKREDGEKRQELERIVQNIAWQMNRSYYFARVVGTGETAVIFSLHPNPPFPFRHLDDLPPPPPKTMLQEWATEKGKEIQSCENEYEMKEDVLGLGGSGSKLSDDSNGEGENEGADQSGLIDMEDIEDQMDAETDETADGEAKEIGYSKHSKRQKLDLAEINLYPEPDDSCTEASRSAMSEGLLTNVMTLRSHITQDEEYQRKRALKWQKAHETLRVGRQKQIIEPFPTASTPNAGSRGPTVYPSRTSTMPTSSLQWFQGGRESMTYDPTLIKAVESQQVVKRNHESQPVELKLTSEPVPGKFQDHDNINVEEVRTVVKNVCEKFYEKK